MIGAFLMGLSSGRAIDPIDVSVTDTGATEAAATITVKSDGSVDQIGLNIGTTTIDWHSPPVSGIGASYWVRVTGSGDTPTGTLNSWLQLNTDRSWTLTLSGIGSLSFVGTIEFSRDSGGTVVVSSGTFNLFVDVAV